MKKLISILAWSLGSIYFLLFYMACCSISTISGTGTAGDIDGPPTLAQYNRPMGVVADPVGNLYVADYGNHKIRMIDHSTGNVITIAGTGTAGCVEGPALEAQLGNPMDIARDESGNLFIADEG